MSGKEGGRFNLENPEIKLTSDEYNQILKFLYEYNKAANQSDPLRQLLMCLTKYFNCKCASLWFVNSDLRMQNPIGWNIDPKLLTDYAEKYNTMDEYHVKFLGTNGENVASVYEYNDDMRQDTPYLEDLKKHNISHRYAIIIRDHGKIIATLALFKSLDDESDISKECLEVLSPFITQEFLNAQKADSQLNHESVIMTSLLNTSDTGIALFESYNAHEIYYYNAACINYCSKFCSGSSGNGVINEFISLVSAKFGEMWEYLKDSKSVMTATVDGTEYPFSVRLVENTEGASGISAMFIQPLDEETQNIGYDDFFTQLTGREQEITMLIAKGCTNQEIAEKLYISLPTVKTHIRHIFEKANVSNRTSLLAMMSNKSQQPE